LFWYNRCKYSLVLCRFHLNPYLRQIAKRFEKNFWKLHFFFFFEQTANFFFLASWNTSTRFFQFGNHIVHWQKSRRGAIQFGICFADISFRISRVVEVFVIVGFFQVQIGFFIHRVGRKCGNCTCFLSGRSFEPLLPAMAAKYWIISWCFQFYWSRLTDVRGCCCCCWELIQIKIPVCFLGFPLFISSLTVDPPLCIVTVWICFSFE
jgi:hypothetical protein